MQSYQFIFSDKFRLQRHLAFWFCWWTFGTILYAFTPAIVSIPLIYRLSIVSIDSLVYLIPHAFLSYSLVYFVVPVYVLRNRYILTAISVVLLFFVTAIISAFLGIFFLEHVRYTFILANTKLPFPKSLNGSFYLALLAGLRGGITIGGIAASIKIMKHLYSKEQRNMQLQKEHIQSQLQVLKAQIHPHFLFNTLNNIYSYTQDTSPVASGLIMGLSDMLRYMLYECNQRLVPLKNEVEMLRNYITLEKIRYGNKLEVNLDILEQFDDLEIAPLLLLPFVENSFKHGASQMLDQPWLSLSITITGCNMDMKLVNGKAENYHSPGNSAGLGMQNVQRRLELLYPGKHLLKIKDEEEVFIVDLKLELVKTNTLVKQNMIPEKTAVYE
jgi:sensor histidine kinase YesM